MPLRICLLGFGEVGQLLAADLAPAHTLTAWDLQFTQPDSTPSVALARHGTVVAGRDAHDAARSADLVISAVTAGQALTAARSVSACLASGTYFVDMNSVSPGVKQQAARMIHGGQGRYVEAAVMSAFPAQRLAVPMYLGGPHAGNFLAIAQAVGLSGATVLSEHIGPASATKMCRSILVKGMESLLLESMLTARHFGVERVVLESLADLLPAEDWPALARYMMSRALVHGRRRAEEMHEACLAVSEARLAPLLSAAVAQRQAWAAQHQAAAQHGTLEPLLDAIRQQLPMTEASQ